MIIAIILLAIIIICVVVIRSTDNDTAYLSCMFIFTVAALYLFVHLPLWATASYEYDKALAEREALVQTLEISRNNADIWNYNSMERAGILTTVAEFNRNLAIAKYQNTLFLFDDYIDDRVDSVKPIK